MAELPWMLLASFAVFIIIGKRGKLIGWLEECFDLVTSVGGEEGRILL
jgi:hypothetical protein